MQATIDRNDMNKLKQSILTLILLIVSTMQTIAAEIPSEYLNKWVTLKTENGYYFYAIEEDNQIKLGQTQTAPSSANYAAYCWQIEGNATDGYTFRCLKYESQQGPTPDDQKRYITNPESLQTSTQEVRLTNTPSRYFYTSNHQLQLAANTSLYLAFYSRNYHTIRLHNSADYVGSRMVIGDINSWSVAAVVYGTETEGADGIPQGTYLPNGGVTSGTTNYPHGSSLYLNDESLGKLSIIPIAGYAHSSIKIDTENHYIVAYYIGEQSGIKYKNATTGATPAVTGKDNTIWTLEASNYITNTSGNYTTVPANKAWQMEMVVQNTNATGNDPSFNRWGSCILASNGDPLNTYYWGNFQIYQHAPTHNNPNTLNFKSSKADGNDHIIAQGASVANKSYKVIVRYNGNKVYVIRTIILDADLNETSEVYNNVWVTALPQVDINQMSCALPTGINLHSLKISIAEESNLLEGMDYAIQNIGTSQYLTTTATPSIYAGDAAKYQVEFTGINDLTYAEQDGGLHYSFYIKNSDDHYLSTGNNFVANKSDATPFIYTTSQHIAPITQKNTLATEWTINSNDTWLWDFFANFYVEVAGNASGGLTYTKNGTPQTATNGQYIELPSGVEVSQMANSSQLGHMAGISKADIRIKVQYTALDNTFYNISPKNDSPTLHYWYKGQNKLVTYSTTNSQSGQDTPWGDIGDCSKYTIAKAEAIPVKVNSSGNRYYGSIYCPNALTLPAGIKAYRLNRISDDGGYMLKPIDSGSILPANTPAVLISDEGVSSDPSGNWSLNPNDRTVMTESNLFSGVFIDTANPGKNAGTSSTVYVLGSKNASIGFYPYTGANIPAFKAYHQLDQPSSAAPARFLFIIDDSGTSTALTIPQSTDTPSVYYDLQGRRIHNPLPGHLYISNGQKIVF